jgi:hypothetical protein
VVIVQGGSATDLVTSVTYGGVPLSRRRFDIETTEAGCRLHLLGCRQSADRHAERGRQPDRHHQTSAP